MVFGNESDFEWFAFCGFVDKRPFAVYSRIYTTNANSHNNEHTNLFVRAQICAPILNGLSCSPHKKDAQMT